MFELKKQQLLTKIENCAFNSFEKQKLVSIAQEILFESNSSHTAVVKVQKESKKKTG
jgi:hypothetical protein